MKTQQLKNPNPAFTEFQKNNNSKFQQELRLLASQIETSKFFLKEFSSLRA